jgi:hypothetical protein
MTQSTDSLDKLCNSGSTKVHHSGAVEYLEQWAANHTEVQFFHRCAGWSGGRGVSSALASLNACLSSLN